MRLYTLILLVLMSLYNLNAQSEMEAPEIQKDSIPSEPIIFTTESASDYIKDLLELKTLWRPSGDTMRLSLSRLIDHFNEPFDSVQSRLETFPYDSVRPAPINLVSYDTIPVRWLNDSTLIIDTLALPHEPFKIKKTLVRRVVDTTSAATKDSIPALESLIDFMQHKKDSMHQKKDTLIHLQAILPHDKDSLGSEVITIRQVYDTIFETVIDTALLSMNKIKLHQLVKNRIRPPFVSPGSHKSSWFIRDSSKIIISDTTRAIAGNEASPFYLMPSEKMTDSLQVAVMTLLNYTGNRDSFLLYLNDIQGQKTPLWLSNRNNDLYRYWVKNYKNDSITIWMGNPSKREMTLILEEDINVNRLEKQTADHIPVTMARPQLSLAKVEPLKEIPVYWDYDLASSLALSQTFLSNWSKGGESSISTILDINGTAKYTNKEAKTEWTNSGRLKYGSIITEENGIRTNTDLLEFNSQYNKVIRKKVDFSSVFYMKNQIARGYKYPNDSVVVSKFLNPATFTVGAGLEYKPFKKTTLNYSILSYKNTFVLDTANIDQTAHGIAADKRAKQEMGGQLVIKNSMTILEDLNMTNSIRLFSNYLDKPGNVDVDWEINLDKRINWFFTIKLNLHMIYDDNIRFPVLDENDQPVILPDGSKKKVPKLQFKQFLGLTLAFKF